MKAKKYLVGCLLGLSATAFAIGASACDTSILSSVRFKDWEKTSKATASLGQTYKFISKG